MWGNRGGGKNTWKMEVTATAMMWGRNILAIMTINYEADTNTTTTNIAVNYENDYVLFSGDISYHCYDDAAAVVVIVIVVVVVFLIFC